MLRRDSMMPIAILSLATLLVPLLFRTHIVLMVLILIPISAAMVWSGFSKVRLHVFLIGFVFGPLAEAICIAAGMWTYSEALFIGLPAWLPFAWGNASLAILSAETWLKKVMPPEISTR